MLRYILLVALIGYGLSDAYKTKHPRQREYFNAESDYGDYDDYVYPVPIYAKDSEAGSERPSIFSYWNRLLKRTRLPSWNLTNPFTRLFSPYVIKVDFPPGTDPNVSQPTRNRNTKKKTEQHDNYIYVNSYANNDEAENPQYFYDPVTQQYYEVQETVSEDYDPQNNYYATTFKDDDEIVLTLDSNDRMTEKDQTNDDEAEAERRAVKLKNVNLIGRYNSPVIKSLKTKLFSVERSAASDYRKAAKRTRKVGRFASV